ncbi:MAG: hypothetical protein FJY85_16980, partial [Deltaproteobacteria bacterium]|nr:hypothetical protein [Deltaproteobacteria bacterium]
KTLELCSELDALPKPLVNGHELMSLFGLEPGPYLGLLIKRLAELQGTGELTTRQDAIAAANNFIREDRDTGRTTSTGQNGGSPD